MKTPIKFLVTAAALLATVGFGLPRADARVENDGPRQGHYLKKIVTELGLTAEQQQEIRGIIRKNRPQAQPIRQQLITERRALRALVQAQTVDEAAIRAQSAKVGALEADMAVQRAHTAHELRAVLTPEQVEKFKALQKKRDLKLDRMLSRVANRPVAD
jgi:protein CpxP